MEHKAKWIWVDRTPQFDTYGEFYSEFEYHGEALTMHISVDSNYMLYINGEFVNSGQYCDFPHYKVYDELDISGFCKEGINRLGIVVWYYGKESFTYCPGNAGIWYKICDKDRVIAYSGEQVLSRYSRTFKNGYQKIITDMMGFSFFYDTTKEDDWKTGQLEGFSVSVAVEQDLQLHPRKTKKIDILKPVASTLIKSSRNYYLYDLGQEEVGYLTLKVKSKKQQLLTICYGEHILDGVVRRKIGPRDFSVEVVVGEGVTEYVNYFRRLGLRYLEIHSEDELEIEYATVCPCPYPLKIVDKKFNNPLHQRIYDVSVRTLYLCMHEHYEDCPWREQSLYIMDSRNQMLCGYYAFEEYVFPRENLYLYSKDNREDKLFSICAPTAFNLTIPSFSLHYFTAVYEYMKYSGDFAFAQEIFPKLQDTLDVFLGNMENGLTVNLTKSNYWNFYEWTEDLQGALGKPTDAIAEAALNCMLSIALQNMHKICDMLGVDSTYQMKAEELNLEIHKTFYQEESGLFVNNLVSHKKSELVNSLVVLCGAAKGYEAERICEVLSKKNELSPITLSMACFLYDALLLTDTKRYKEFVIHNIEEKYKRMLDMGATTFWETEEGDAVGAGAGSLCHGWSAMPVYYFSLLLTD